MGEQGEVYRAQDDISLNSAFQREEDRNRRLDEDYGGRENHEGRFSSSFDPMRPVEQQDLGEFDDILEYSFT